MTSGKVEWMSGSGRLRRLKRREGEQRMISMGMKEQCSLRQHFAVITVVNYSNQKPMEWYNLFSGKYSDWFIFANLNV